MHGVNSAAAWLVIATLAASGCGSVLASGAGKTGEPLRVEVRDNSYSALVAEPVGQLTTTDSTGARIATTTITENRLMRVSDVHWRGMQGNAPISDEDLFRLAGDAEAADLDAAYRRDGRLMQVVGGVFAIAGLTENLVAREQGWTSSTAQALSIAGYGGFVGGVIMVVFGTKRLSADRHPVARERAEDAVQRYNQTLSPPGAARLSFVPDLMEVHGSW